MAESIGYFNEALSLFDRSIKLANDVKTYLTPQYNDAALALFKIFDKLLETFHNILDLYYEFERLDLKNTVESKEEFLNFDRRFFKFRTGKEYDNLKLLCDDIGKIYRAKLDKPLREWFNRDPSKFYLAKEHFDEAEKIDMTVSKFIDEILEQLKETVLYIKKDYTNGQEKQRIFLEWSNNYLTKLEEQFNELRKLRREFLNLARVTFSNI